MYHYPSYIHTYIHTHEYTLPTYTKNTHTQTCIHVYMCEPRLHRVSLPIQQNIYIHKCIYVCMYVYTYIHTYIYHTHTHMYIYTLPTYTKNTHTHIYIRAILVITHIHTHTCIHTSCSHHKPIPFLSHTYLHVMRLRHTFQKQFVYKLRDLWHITHIHIFIRAYIHR
jgi:hypothetical protein